MNKRPTKRRQRLRISQTGSIALVSVFITSMVMFLLVYADNAVAVKEKLNTRDLVESEQAFYAAQSCLEESYLKLRQDPTFTAATIATDEVDCSLTVEHPDPTDPESGSLVSVGTEAEAERTIVTAFTQSAEAERGDTSIFHVVDQSTSMSEEDQYCVIGGIRRPAGDPLNDSATDCRDAGGIYYVEPLATVTNAAINFLGALDVAHDRIGVLSFNTSVYTRHELSVDYLSVTAAIRGVNTAFGATNIGDALKTATDKLITEPEERSRVIILLSDGEPNRPLQTGNPDYPKEYALQMAQRAKDNGIAIFVIGYGPHINTDPVIELLSTIATTVGGYNYFFNVQNIDDIDDRYQDIADIIVSYTIEQSGWNEM